ncbi:MAG: hypothetical protein IPO26_21225 [Saprospiraceae bacterium]|nr:hypothetical protein [Saprospiraceae bacterium]
MIDHTDVWRNLRDLEKSKILFNNQPLQNIDAVIPRPGSTTTTYGAAVIRRFEGQSPLHLSRPSPCSKQGGNCLIFAS